VAEIDTTGRIQLPEIIVACDVDHPLCGPRGASAVFGPQKGATPEDVTFLDGVLGRLAEISQGSAMAEAAGAGAAGGLGFGLMRFADARLVSGFELVAEALGLREKIAASDLVVTGEGSLDAQTLGGKGPAGVAEMARAAGVPVVAIAGRSEPEAAVLFDAVFSLQSFALPVAESMTRAAELIRRIMRENRGSLERIVFSRNEGKSR
jgi:glycerate 2-kinase